MYVGWDFLAFYSSLVLLTVLFGSKCVSDKGRGIFPYNFISSFKTIWLEASELP